MLGEGTLKLYHSSPYLSLIVDIIIGENIKYFWAEVAQVVEQRTENPRVGGSTPPLGTKKQPATL